MSFEEFYRSNELSLTTATDLISARAVKPQTIRDLKETDQEYVVVKFVSANDMPRQRNN